jgi:predicted metal-dependent hydrolase
MEQIAVSNIQIDVIRKDIKNIHLAVYPPAGRVRISVPLSVNEDAIRLFVISKLGWIKQKQRQFKGQDRITPREYKDRESHYFFGDRYLLNVIETDLAPKVSIRNKTYVDLFVKPKTPTHTRHKIMEEWYRREIKKMIPNLIEKWEDRMGIHIDDWRVKRMKTRWGSCNIGKKRIWINLELAKKPDRCLEYVIVHEMVHLFERKHNDRFIKLIDEFMPNWRGHRDELNRLPISHVDWKY